MKPSFCLHFRMVFPGMTLVALMLPGCDKPQEGPTRYTVSGTVKFDGEPIPKGFITFEPTEGTGGPGGGAPIENGHYETPEGKGLPGGKYQVKITGFDGKKTLVEKEVLPDGEPLFQPWKTTAELPQEDSTQNFEVPQEAANPSSEQSDE